MKTPHVFARRTMSSFSSCLSLMALIIGLMAMPLSAGTVWDGTADTSWYNTNDTSFTLTTAEQLAGLATLVSAGTDVFTGKTITLGDDIVLNDTSDWANWGTSAPTNTWTPIGVTAHYFAGTFDGDGHTVSGVYVNDTMTLGAGLFGIVDTAGMVQNVVVSESYVRGSTYVAGVVGLLQGGASNCTNTGIVRGQIYVGGIIGYSGTNWIYSCHNSGTVTGVGTDINTPAISIGGILGSSYGSIVNCINTGTVDFVYGSEQVGGIVGHLESGMLENCYNIGTLSGTTDVGGIIGVARGNGVMCHITNVYSSATITGTTRVGGVVGLIDGTTPASVTYSYWDSTLYSGGGDGQGSSLGTGCSSYTTAQMKASAFVTLLNDRRGFRCPWRAVTNGTPTLLDIPYVSTQAVSSVGRTTATGNGTIEDLGYSLSTAYGVCWNTTGSPTTADSKVDKGAAASMGAFTASMTGLSDNTTYYVRAFAKNIYGTAYGDEVSFTTGVTPDFSIAGPQTYSVGTAIATLTPTNAASPPTAMQVALLAGTTGEVGSTDGAATSAKFNTPVSVVADGSGNVYVADYSNHRIRKITPAGVVSTFAGSTSGYTNDTGTAAQFTSPQGLAIDSDGVIYVADRGNYRIRKITSAGVVTTLAGSGSSGSTNDTGTLASFDYPSDVAVDSNKNVYVADFNNHKIRKITPAGVVSTFAGSGASGSADGTGTAATFNHPTGVTVDADDNVIVADFNNNKIRKITPAGVVTTIAGSGAFGSADGTGTAATFNYPYDVAVDTTGIIYVSDKYNEVIRTIAPNGVVTTFAGTGSTGAVDGTGTAASFNLLSGLAFDSSGHLLVADMSNHTIRKIAPYRITPALPAGLSFNRDTGAITGTPTAVSAQTTYTIYGTNAHGTDSATVAITVNAGAPTVGSPSSASVDDTTGTLGGNITALNGADITERGIYWSTTSGFTPPGAGTKISDTGTWNATGTFTVDVTGLPTATTIYFKAFAKNSAGTGYSSQTSFNTAKSDQTITFATLEERIASDAAFDLTATASSGLAVTYTSSNTAVATITGHTVTIVGPGTTTITASQAGNATYNPATDIARTLIVGLNGQRITFEELEDRTVGDATFDLTATASSGLTVTYVSSNTDVATISGHTVTIVGPGITTITASQAGNATYNPATDAEQTLTVNPADPAGTAVTDADGHANVTTGTLNGTVAGFDPNVPVTLTNTDGTATLAIGESTDRAFTASLANIGDDVDIDVNVADDRTTLTITQSNARTVTLVLVAFPAGMQVGIDLGDQAIISSLTDGSGQTADVTIETTDSGENVSFTLTWHAPANNALGKTIWTAPFGSVTIDADGLANDGTYRVVLSYANLTLGNTNADDLRLLSVDGDTLTVAGTTDRGVTAPTKTLGDFGVDTTTHTVWANVDALGTFAVGAGETQDDTEIITTVTTTYGCSALGTVLLTLLAFAFAGLTCRND